MNDKFVAVNAEGFSHDLIVVLLLLGSGQKLLRLELLWLHK